MSMEHDTAVASQESWVEIKGTKYRKYEFNSGVYYIKFKNPESAAAELYCDPPPGYKNERLVVEQPAGEKRSRAFVQIFHENCPGTKAAPVKVIQLSPKVGLTFPESKKAKD